MTKVEFIFNVDNKLVKTANICEAALVKGHQLTIFSPDETLRVAISQQLWCSANTRFLPNCDVDHQHSQHAPIHLAVDGAGLLQDDILFNFHQEVPVFFGRFRKLIELVGVDEEDKVCARIRYKFYRDRGYEINTIDMSGN
jgi:DNA polymerase III subunit chi